MGYDDDVASEMAAVASQARRQGGIRAAISAQECAADLTRDPAERAGRLLVGAEMAFEHGSYELVGRLLAQADQLGLGPAERRRATWVREMFQDGTAGDAQRIRFLVDEAGRHRPRATSISQSSFSSGRRFGLGGQTPERTSNGRSPRHRPPLGVVSDDPRLLVVFATTAPGERGESIISALARARATDIDDANALRLLGMAARALGEFDYALSFLERAASGLRARGASRCSPRLSACRLMPPSRLVTSRWF